MSEYACDRCGIAVPEGSGHYPDDDSDDRICADCADKATHHNEQPPRKGAPMSEYACDRCGVEVPNGSGHYPDGDSGDRICADCAAETT